MIKPEQLIEQGCDPQAVADWFQTRKDKRAPKLTQTALNAILKQAVLAGLELPEVVQIMAENGWRGFKAQWLDNQKVVEQKSNRNAVSESLRNIQNTDW